jgi:hypothetical protein
MRRSVAITIAGGVAGALAAYAYRRLRGRISAPREDHVALAAEELVPRPPAHTAGDESANAGASFVSGSAGEALAAHDERVGAHDVAARAPLEGRLGRTRVRARPLPRAERLPSHVSPLLLVAAALNAGLLGAVVALGGGNAQHQVQSWLQLLF